MPLGRFLVLMILPNFHISRYQVFVSSNVIFGESLVGMGTDVVQHEQISCGTHRVRKRNSTLLHSQRSFSCLECCR